MDNKGPFRDRLEFVGNPARRDGSILIRNLDFADNGTFTCDAKNPPDIVGRPSSVRLLVFEKSMNHYDYPFCNSLNQFNLAKHLKFKFKFYWSQTPHFIGHNSTYSTTNRIYIN